MRLCRFSVDEVVLTGFYADDRVIPISQAAEAYMDAEGRDLELPATEDLLELLPPEGDAFPAMRKLATWLEGLDAAELDGLALPLEEVQLLVPIARPPKILLLAGNYTASATECEGTAAKLSQAFPAIFMKPPSTTLTHSGDPIVIPRNSSDRIDAECALGVVIGRRCHDVTAAEALDYVAGYTILIDVSDRQFALDPAQAPRARDTLFDELLGKWRDTFCPVGPSILSADAAEDPQTLALTLTVNGQPRQATSTARMVFPVATIVAFLSEHLTLEPGDIVATGTPAGEGTATFLRPGDVVAATIEGIGSLVNPVAAEED